MSFRHRTAAFGGATIIAIASFIAPANAVSGGVPAAPNPALAKIVSNGSMCTAALVSPTAVLTAAHCVNPSSTGSVTFGAGGRDGSVKFVGVSINPNADMAVLYLEHAMLDRLPMAVLPAPPVVGAPARVTGWGKGGVAGFAQQRDGQVSMYRGGKVYVKNFAGGSSTQPGDSGGPITSGGLIIGVVRGGMWSSATGNHDFGAAMFDNLPWFMGALTDGNIVGSVSSAVSS